MLIIRKRNKYQLVKNGKSHHISALTARMLIRRAPFVTTNSYVHINTEGYGDMGLKTIIHLKPVEKAIYANPCLEIPDNTKLPIWLAIRRHL